MESENQSMNSSQDDCIVLALSPLRSTPSTGTDTPQQSISKPRLSKAEITQRKSERDARKAEEEAARAEKKRLQEELKAKKAEEIRLEKARKAEELQQEKARRAEEKARKAEELQQEKARKAEELLQEKARKAEELQQEKARRAEERARKEADNASKKAEIMQKKEQKQAAAQKQEMLQKQMANTMNKYFKPIEKSTQKDGQTATTNNNCVYHRCTDDFDQIVCKQDVNFVSDLLENLRSMKPTEVENAARPRLNSDSSSCTALPLTTTTTMNNQYVLKTRYIHFPEKYFNRPPYYGTLKKALTANANPLQPDAAIDNIDYAVDSEGEWEEPCKDGEELRSDAEDLSDSEAVDSDSDTDSFIVPHGHLSDDELNEDEQQQSTVTKQAREAAKSHVWDKKVARLNQQRELKPIFGCIYDPALDDKVKFELSNYFHQFKRILVPKEICQKPEQEEKEQEVTEESAPNGDKPKRVSKKKSTASKKSQSTEQQQASIIPSAVTPTAKRISSASILVESASPSKRRKMNSNENCSMIDDTDVVMTDAEAINSNKTNVLEDASNVTDVKSSPLTLISNDEIKIDSTPICTLLIPKRKQPPV
ncbi:unnamed protein product [Adineta ricciae]|uniref:Chromatin assembly factor 1 subunit A dimerization domain-containing protein n=1 Tax=Adineta ricciae TaxID=249248 RepID=A0A814F554_ADIRI|nr:unnamed protein product [Adineta ricciae]CAF1040305.1 unnamed protein product [Adineta ricciae]